MASVCCCEGAAGILSVVLAGYMGMGVVVFKLGLGGYVGVAPVALNLGGSGGGVVYLATPVCS
jgi:hypothetical protein